MENNFAIFSGLKNNSRRTLNNTKKHNYYTLTLFPSYEIEFDITDNDNDNDNEISIYDPTDYDTLGDVM